MNDPRRPVANLDRLGLILAAGVLAMLGVTGCGQTVSNPTPTPTRTPSPTGAVEPTASTASTASAAASTAPTVTETPTPSAPSKADVIAIAVGGDHTCALTSGGGVKCWGLNTFDELGNGGTSGLSSTPVDVRGFASAISAISAGEYFTCALTSEGGVMCWGQNKHGQLGDGTTSDSSATVTVAGLTRGIRAISAGYEYACSLTTAGAVKCWGALHLPLLLGPVPTEKRTPFRVASLTTSLSAITSGLGVTCALTTRGGVKCWGTDVYGQLGDGSRFGLYRTPVDVIGLTKGVTAIAANDDVCALTTRGGVKCWGSNQFGQLGNGSTSVAESTPNDVTGLASGITAIAVGFQHACALTDGGGVKCWGHNVDGQLGDGSTTDSSTPVDVVGLASGVTGIAANGYDTCAITSGGQIKCWGDNAYGQLGDGTTTNRLTPVDVTGL